MARRRRLSDVVTEMQVVKPGRLPGLRRCGWAAMLALMTLVLASCAGRAHPGGSTARPPANAGQLRITQILAGSDGPGPTEGTLSYVRVESPAGATLVARQLPGSHKLLLRLKPGAYRLVSWQRDCDGNCGHLDPPSDRCSRPLSVAPRQKLNATIRVNFASGCVIVLSG
jgi:hypothetical protein